MADRDDDNQSDDDVTPRPVPREASSRLAKVVERGIDPEDLALASRLRSHTGDPWTLSARLIRAVEAERESSDSAVERQLGAAIKEHEASLDEIKTKVADLNRTAGTARWIVNGILAAAGVLGVYVLDRILTRAEREGETTIKIQVIERAVDRLERQMERDRDRPDRPDHAPAAKP